MRSISIRPPLFIVSALLACTHAIAQTYPSKPINMLIPLQAGSSVDAILRTVANKMSENMGQQIVVENQAGASGLIGTERLAKAAPDGYTIAGLNDGVLTMLPHMRANLPFDPLTSFEPVSLVAEISWVLIAAPNYEAKSVADLVRLAKARPGQIDYSSGGNGSPQHVAMEVFKAATGTYMTHIPYRGATQSAMDVMSGQIPVSMSGLSIVISHIKAGKLRALAVANPARSPLLPDVPTIAESGVPGYEFATWGALFMPKGTPKPIIDRLHTEVVKAVNDATVRERLSNLGLVPRGSTPAELAEATKTGLEKMGKVIKAAGIKSE
ncbi:MAG: Bug family tripartite tricarboxylate transporter substrate binding protein [Burkholderiales bacterium]